MDPSTLILDARNAYTIGREGIKILSSIRDKFSKAGVEILHPEIRINSSEAKFEFTSGIEFKRSFFQKGIVSLDLPAPLRISLFSLVPYRPLHEGYKIINGKIGLDRDVLAGYNDGFRISLEYNFVKDEAIKDLVYTSSPKDSIRDDLINEESDAYWLHAQLKTVELLKRIYSSIRIEDVELGVEVTVKEHLRDLFDEDVKMELMMNATFSSKDRNESSKAITYRIHHRPKLKGDINRVIYDINELFQPSKFRSYLSLEGNNFRYKNCQKGITFSDPIGPIVLPNYMSVVSSTDLTLDEPAKDGKLIYKKTQFKNKVEKILNQPSEFQPRYRRP